MSEKLKFRFAKAEDSSKILYFIKELAKYVKMEDKVTATEEMIREKIFKNFYKIDNTNISAEKVAKMIK